MSRPLYLVPNATRLHANINWAPALSFKLGRINLELGVSYTFLIVSWHYERHLSGRAWLVVLRDDGEGSGERGKHVVFDDNAEIRPPRQGAHATPCSWHGSTTRRTIRRPPRHWWRGWGRHSPGWPS